MHWRQQFPHDVFFTQPSNLSAALGFALIPAGVVYVDNKSPTARSHLDLTPLRTVRYSGTPAWSPTEWEYFAELNIKQGDTLSHHGLLSSAVEQYRQALDAWPQAPHIAPMIAHRLSVLGKIQWAKTIYGDLIDQGSTDPAVFNNLADLMANYGGPYDIAEQLAEQAVLLSPDNPVFRRTLQQVRERRRQSGNSSF